MSDREQLIRQIADEMPVGTYVVWREHWAKTVLDALDRLGYTVVPPPVPGLPRISPQDASEGPEATQTVERAGGWVRIEHGREFDHPQAGDDQPIPWPEAFHARACPPRGTINGHPWHRVVREVIYTAWRDDSGRAGVEVAP